MIAFTAINVVRCPASSLIGLAFLAACASAPPGGGEPRRRPAEYVVVIAHFEPRVEWEVKADKRYAVGSGDAGGAVADAAARCVLVTGPFFGVCLAVVLPVAALIVGTVSAVQTSRATSAGKDDDKKGYTGSGVREMDLSKLASALDLQSQLKRAVATAGWRVQPEASSVAGELRLEAGVERIKALSTAPIRNLWVHEMEVNWRLVDPVNVGTVASGRFRYEKVLSFSLRYDEASGRWIGEDDGRFAAAWAQACEEMAARIALDAVPAIAAYVR